MSKNWKTQLGRSRMGWMLGLAAGVVGVFVLSLLLGRSADESVFPVPDVVSASAVVDGRVTASDGYVKFADLGSSPDFGDLFFASDADFFYFAGRLNGPTTGGDVANENVFGPTAYHVTHSTGWPRDKHKFKDLKNSDRARFQISCDGQVVHDFVQDYLRPVGDSWVSDAAGDGEVIGLGPSASSSSMVYNMLSSGWDVTLGGTLTDDRDFESPPFDAVAG